MTEMKPSFVFFHLNLAFSSIPECARAQVIEKCYWPILRLAIRQNFKISVEATGYTLLVIQTLAPDWVRTLRELVQNGAIEFVGSGFVQLINPLVPWDVAHQNICRGLEIYDELLNCRPTLLLANEMAASRSTVDLACELGFQGILLERNNVEYLYSSQNHDSSISGSTHVEGCYDELPVIWVDSISFQNFQALCHGRLDLSEYEDYLLSCVKHGDATYLSVYGSDGETFNFRPGRFDDEAEVIGDEFEIMEYALSRLGSLGIRLMFPSEILQDYVLSSPKFVISPTNIVFPITVKKQFHYNVSRWAVTGRSDFNLNAICHEFTQFFKSHPVLLNEYFCDYLPGVISHLDFLLYLWSSDFRTHIGDERWSSLESSIDQFKGNPDFKRWKRGLAKKCESRILVSPNIGRIVDLGCMRVDTRNFGIISLNFSEWRGRSFVRSYRLGEFKNIELGHEFISNNFLYYRHKYKRSCLDHRNTSDAHHFDEHNRVALEQTICVDDHVMCFRMCGYKHESLVELSINTASAFKGDLILRLFYLYFDAAIGYDPLKLHTANGGEMLESFLVDADVNHMKPRGFTVSSSGGLGSTTGKMVIENGVDGLEITWDMSRCPFMPMLRRQTVGGQTIVELCFSVSEIDESSRNHVVGPLDCSIQMRPLTSKELIDLC